MNPYHSLVTNTFQPTVLVLSTLDAQALASASSLALADLFAPFGACLPSLTGPVTTGNLNGQTYDMHNFRIAFRPLEWMQTLPTEALADLLAARVDSKHKPDLPDDVPPPPELSTPDSVASYLNYYASARQRPPPSPYMTAGTSGSATAGSAPLSSAAGSSGAGVSPTPWYDAYHQTLADALRGSEHESFDHPVALLLVSTTRNPTPIEALAGLYSSSVPPTMFENGAMDPNLTAFRLILHEEEWEAPCSGNPETTPATVHARMASLYSQSNFALVRVSTGGDAGPALPPRFWASGRPSTFAFPADAPAPGALLGPADIDALAQFVTNFAVNFLVPLMRRKVHALHERVAVSRKGFKWSKWFKSSKSPEKDGPLPNAAAGPPFIFHYKSPGAQLRVLADLAFLLQDYPLAASVYSLALDEYRKESAWRYYAGAQEALGLATLFYDASHKDVNSSIGSAVVIYHKTGYYANAKRALYLHYKLWRERRAFIPAAHCVMQMTASQNNPLFVALSLEQVAHCFLAVFPTTKLRKFVMYAMMAANRFADAGQASHALRLYTTLLRIESAAAAGWLRSHDTLRYNVARLTFKLGDRDGSVDAMGPMLASSVQSPTVQATYLNNYIRVVQGANSALGDAAPEARDLPLPRLDEASLRVLSPYSRPPPAALAYAFAALHTPHDFASPNAWWRSFEDELLRAGTVRGAPRNNAWSVPHHDNIHVIGETIAVELELVNPLAVQLVLSSLRLTATPAEAYTATSVELTLGANERRKLTLSLVPNSVGNLALTGLRFSLNSAIEGRVAFSGRGPRLFKTVADRTSVSYAPDARLALDVVPPLPCLAVTAPDGVTAPVAPPTVPNHAVVTIPLRLTNTGQRPLSYMRAKCSVPGAAVFEPDSGLGVLHTDAFDGSLMYFDGCGGDGSGAGLELAPGESRELTLRLKFSGHLGTRDVHVLFYYTGPANDEATESGLYRFARLYFTTNVVPSLRCRGHVLDSPASPTALLYALSVDNLLRSPVVVTDVTFVAAGMRFTRASGADADEAAPVVPSRGSVTLHYHVTVAPDAADAVPVPTALALAQPDADTSSLLSASPAAMGFLSHARNVASTHFAPLSVHALVAWNVAAPNPPPTIHGLAILPPASVLSLGHPLPRVPGTPAASGAAPSEHVAEVDESRAVDPAVIVRHVLLGPEQRVYHDFGASPLALVDLTLTITNLSLATPASARFVPAHTTVPWMWLGAAHNKAINLAPRATATVALHVAFSSPGSYNVASHSLAVQLGDRTARLEPTFATWIHVEHRSAIVRRPLPAAPEPVGAEPEPEPEPEVDAEPEGEVSVATDTAPIADPEPTPEPAEPEVEVSVATDTAPITDPEPTPEPAEPEVKVGVATDTAPIADPEPTREPAEPSPEPAEPSETETM
ncbi:uncharacterized protein AMSG_11054 [Thecamonas trahens ATCC 50062]|uniref:TPPC8 first Ig-like domain-containing protein n=1 Tax=Thecamonas trahens ATCC 50062 TaxID=461836 RepID=A0A0L0DSZ7_THETB|nr:hypothetical protein AMSG_11054 [Thecamonas trahens ATCC 50062]KNC55395.1 hypothetical protein AMSG_11054 [Thecamonas trahens ATCC 50062]|eukprot:XP_013753026.1 hypothetical protein AMSG_11054 [Thecamonas trahens ATCC 50062]